MSTASVTNTFVNATAADAAEVNQNFTDVVSFLNGNVLHVDGTKSLSGNLDLGANRIVDVAAATGVANAPRFDQSGVANHEVTSGSVNLPLSTLTAIDTINVTTPAAGVVLLAFRASFTYAGTSGGLGTATTTITVSGGSWSTTVAASNDVTTNGTGTVTAAALFVVGVPSGSTTLTVNGTLSSSGGTCQVNSGAATMITGGF